MDLFRILISAAAATTLLTGCATPLAPRVEAPKLGVPVAADALAAQTLNVFPDGRGLPPGQGSVKEGAQLFVRHCAGCHGRDGRGGTAEELTGAIRPLDHPAADKTIGSYWPFATTLFDFIRRAKPMTAPIRMRMMDFIAPPTRREQSAGRCRTPLLPAAPAHPHGH